MPGGWLHLLYPLHPSIGPAKDRNFPTSARLDIRAKGWRPRDTCGFLWRQLELTDHWLETAAELISIFLWSTINRSSLEGWLIIHERSLGSQMFGDIILFNSAPDGIPQISIFLCPNLTDDSQISLLPLGFSLHFLGIACLSTPGCYQRLSCAWRLTVNQRKERDNHVMMDMPVNLETREAKDASSITFGRSGGYKMNRKSI